MEISEVSESWQPAQVFEIRKKTFVEGQNIPLQAEFDEIYGETYHYLLLHEKDQGIGTAGINLDAKEYGKIERVAVIPSYQSNAPNLYPKTQRTEIDQLNEKLFHEINNGVYKARFAQSQIAYEKAYDQLFNSLDRIERKLATQRYLLGNQLTDADIRLYVTLARFDVAYYSVFKTNRNRICDFPNLWNYAKDLYQTPGFGSTIDFEAIKMVYQLGDVENNSYQILVKGPDVSIWQEAHDRARF